MKRIVPLLALVVLAVVLAACQKPAPAPDYGPRFDALAAQVEEVSGRIEAISGDLSVLTAAVSGVKADVQALTTQAQALGAISMQVEGLVGVVHRLDPANSAMLTINHPPGLALTVTPGACADGLPAADETAYDVDTRSVSRLGLPVGPACVTSTDPPAQLQIELQAGQLLGIYFNAPPTANGGAE